MKYQGIVIHILKNKAVVTTDDFQCFYIKRRPTLHVGKEIEFSDKEIIVKRPILKTLIFSAACVFILFAITSFSNLADVFNVIFEPKVFAYVGVDINPSLEIEIDEIGSVLRLVPINEDAKVLIKELKPYSISLSETIDKLIDALKENNAINEVEIDHILVSSTLNIKKNIYDKEYLVEKEKLNSIMMSLKNDIQVKDTENVNIHLVETNFYERKEAKSLGISTGRYVLYTKNEDLRNSLSVEDAKRVNLDILVKDISMSKLEKHYMVDLTPEPTPSPLKTEDIKLNEFDTPPSNAEDSNEVNETYVSPIVDKEETTNNDLTNVDKEETVNNDLTNADKEGTNTSIFWRFESYNYREQFIQHKSFKALISQDTTTMDDTVFKIIPGLADSNCISFESKNFPGYYLKHENFRIILKKDDGSDSFKEDATFKKVPGLADNNLVSYQSYNFPDRYIRHRKFYLYIEEISTDLEKKDATYTEVIFE